MKLLAVSAGMLALMTSTLCAAELKVPMNKGSASGVGDSIGTIVISQKPTGIDVTGIPPGPLGFHVHETGNCAPASKSHKGPKGAGQKGDLP